MQYSLMHNCNSHPIGLPCLANLSHSELEWPKKLGQVTENATQKHSNVLQTVDSLTADACTVVCSQPLSADLPWIH